MFWYSISSCSSRVFVLIITALHWFFTTPKRENLLLAESVNTCLPLPQDIQLFCIVDQPVHGHLCVYLKVGGSKCASWRGISHKQSWKIDKWFNDRKIETTTRYFDYILATFVFFYFEINIWNLYELCSSIFKTFFFHQWMVSQRSTMTHKIFLTFSHSGVKEVSIATCWCFVGCPLIREKELILS